MADETLSQGDIDALLKGLDVGGPPAAAPPPATAAAPAAMPAPPPAAAVPRGGPADHLQKACRAAVDTAGADLSRAVEMRQVGVDRRAGAAAVDQIKLPAVIFYGDVPGGGFLMAMSKDMGGRLSDIKMGGDGSKPPETFSDLYLSAVSEFVNLISGSFYGALASSGRVTNPRITVAETREDVAQLPVFKLASCTVLTVPVAIENLSEGDWIMVMGDIPSAQAPAAQMPSAPATPASESRPAQKVEFGAFDMSPAPEMPANMNLLLDVPMNVTVELGRTKMTVHDVLNLGSGSIVELDKLAGEPVDFMVNGKLIAKGEVVVIDENFGIRITDIVSPMERFRGSF